MIDPHLMPDCSSDVIFANFTFISACDVVKVLVLLAVKVLWSLIIVETLLSLLLLINKTIFGILRHQLPHHTSIVLQHFIRSGFSRHLVLPDAPLQPILWRFICHPGLNLLMFFVCNWHLL